MLAHMLVFMYDLVGATQSRPIQLILRANSVPHYVSCGIIIIIRLTDTFIEVPILSDIFIIQVVLFS